MFTLEDPPSPFNHLFIIVIKLARTYLRLPDSFRPNQNPPLPDLDRLMSRSSHNLPASLSQLQTADICSTSMTDTFPFTVCREAAEWIVTDGMKTSVSRACFPPGTTSPIFANARVHICIYGGGTICNRGWRRTC